MLMSLIELRRQFYIVVMLAASVLAFMAAAAEPSNAIGRAETLLLNVTINTQLLPNVVRAEQLADGRLALAVASWNAAHLRLPAGEPLLLPDNQYGYVLEAVSGLTYRLDRSQMLLAITAPASAFTTTAINQQSVAVVLPNIVQPGFYLDYDSSISSGDHGYESHGVLLEGVAFSNWGAAVSGLLVTGDRHHNQTIRTETYWRKDLPSPMETLVVGDTIGDGGAWSRPARYAGIRWARDFSLRPGFIAMPMPSLSGTAALPSTIDVLINNQRRRTDQVNPGPFELTNVPVTNGAGEINLIVRDLLGRESIINQSYYFSPRLLAKGLSDFSVEAGFLRENYGVQSNDYDNNGFIAGTRRYGLSSALTGEVRFEAQQQRQAIGVDLVALLGTFATIEAALATARTDDGQGNHYLLGLERRTAAGNASLRWEYFDRDFVQFAALPSELRPRQRISASLGALLSGHVSTAINYTVQKAWDESQLELLTANLGVTLADGIYLSSYASKDLGTEGGWSAGITVNLSLGKQRSASASTNTGSNRDTINRAELSQSPPGGPGSGWRLAVSDDPNQRWRMGLSRNTNFGSFRAEATDTINDPAVRLGASGSIGWLGGHAFAVRTIGAGSFAVVKVDSIANVPIYRSNQLIATTNASGMALVPDLLPYQQNPLTINPIELPFDIEIQSVREVTVPYARSGLVVNFPVYRSRNALVVLHQRDGSVVPAGARVTVSPNETSFIVGKRGEAYLMDLTDSNHLTVQWPDHVCELLLPLDPAGPSEPRIGPVTCGERP